MPLMLVLCISTLLGFLTGLGVGGGSLLILWLTLAENQSPEIARGINLLFFLPSALIACLFRCRQGKLELPRVWPAMAAGAAAAAVFSMISSMLPPDALQKPFGILLLATGIREVFYRPRKAR